MADDAAAERHLRAALERTGGGDPFRVLGVDRGADDAVIRAAFLEATKSYHPNRFARRNRDVVRLSNEVFLRFKEAYEEIADEAGRTRVRERLAEAEAEAKRRPRVRTATPVAGVRPVAAPRKVGKGTGRAPVPRRRPVDATPPGVPLNDDEFERGVEHCRAGHYEEARILFQRLAVTDPATRKYRVHLAYAWGCEYQAAGRSDEARVQLERAVTLDPDFEPARQALAALPRKRRGLLSKLFRR